MKIARGLVIFFALLFAGSFNPLMAGAEIENANGIETFGNENFETYGIYNPCNVPAPPEPWTPPGYIDLRDALQTQINNFDATIASQWNGSRYPVDFSASLSAATSHRGRDLLNSSLYIGVLLELDRLAALGIRAVTVTISFPLLDSNFTTDPIELQGYIDFYKQFANDVRSRGLKLIVESGALFPDYTNLPVQSYYQNLTLDEYRKGRFRVVETIASEIQPDYLTIGTEPDTEEMLTGQPIANPVAYTEQVNFILDGLDQAGIQDIPIGAGVGTWDPDYISYITSLADNTNLSLIDIHVYPVNFDFLDRILTIADIAKSRGKSVSMSEAWLYKARNIELLFGISYAGIFARDAMSFFAPLDQDFIRSIVNVSHYKQLEFASFFWEKYFFAYLDYNQTIGLTPMQIQDLSALAAVNAMLNNVYSDTGTAYAIAIDTTSPSTPFNLQGTPLSQTEVSLQWSASSDNLGVACYFVYRESVKISTVSATSYTDTGLSPGTTYDYGVVAYDQAGNPSQPANVTVTTNSEPNQAPVAAFSFTPTYPTISDVVFFQDLSNDSDGTLVAWAWDFGDGGTSNIRNPTHQYQTSGQKTVTLTVTDDDGATDSVSQTIIVVNQNPVADFTFTPISADAGETVQFSDTSTDDDGTIVSWSWNFGDGSYSTDRNPTHVFESEGSFNITLTVTDNDGGTNQITKTIQIAEPEVPPTNEPSVGLVVIALIAVVISVIVAIALFLFIRKKRLGEKTQ